MKFLNAKLFLLAMSGALLCQGCGRNEDPQSKSAVIPVEAPSKESVSKAEGSGVIRGKVLFSGTAPAPAVIGMTADPFCAAHADAGSVVQSLTVNSNQTLKNAFVYIKEGLEGKVFPVPAKTVTMDQSACRYHPHVFGIQAGQTLEIINSDATLHNVHGLPKASQPFNLGMPIQGMRIKKSFSAPEVMVHMKCDVHPWMSAYAGVVAHPFFAVTGDDGTFELRGVPAGHYIVEVWQEKLGRQQLAVDVPANGEGSAEFTFKG